MTTTTVQPVNIVNILAYVANAFLVNYIGASGKFPTNADISAKYQTLVTPAGYAFAIWGIIFFVQLIWSIIQLFPMYRQSDLVIKGVGYYYVWVCMAQILWTVVFTTEQISLSLFAMICILVPLQTITYSMSEINKNDNRNNICCSYWLLKFPFEIHAAWIIAATIVNFNVVLVALNAPVREQVALACVSLAVVGCVAAGYLLKRKYVFALVLAWASFAIHVELQNPKDSISSVFSSDTITILGKVSEGLAIAILLATVSLVGYDFFMKKMSNASDASASASSVYRPI